MAFRQLALGLLLALLACSPLQAGGGAHVVDDASLEEPGLCHLESWVSAGKGYRYASLAPACTPSRIPWLELGGAIEISRSEEQTELALGPAIKLALGHPTEAIGVALALSATISADTGRLKEFQAFMPVTLSLNESSRISLNAGYIRDQEEAMSAALWGIQKEYDLGPEVALMGEVFGTSRSSVGWQTGLRWTPEPGAVDLDLLASRFPGEGNAITLGLTVRR